MSSFDYGNTRLRSRLSQLLPLEAFEKMAHTDAIEGYLAMLLKTPYRPSVEKALALSSGVESIRFIIRTESEKLIQDFENFYQGSAWEQIKLLFSYDDLLNIQTIVRGVHAGIQFKKIIEVLSRTGTIDFDVLRKLTQSRSIHYLISKMVTYLVPYADVLLLHQQELSSYQGAELAMLLEKTFFEEILVEKKKVLAGSNKMQQYFSMQADEANIMSVLRFVVHPGYAGIDQVFHNEYYIQAGTLSYDLLQATAGEQNIEGAIQRLRISPYAACLQMGVNEYRSTGLLTEFEERLRKHNLQWAGKFPKEDPLGAGVPIGYFVRKKNEMNNLWWIAKGIQLGFDPVDIIHHLEVIE